jgi:hypothetical protein
MKHNALGAIVAALVMLYFANGYHSRAATKDGDEATAMMQNIDAEERAAAAARSKDASWNPTCKELSKIQVGSGRAGTLRNFCLDGEGNVLACVVGGSGGNEGSLRVYSPDGKLLRTMKLTIRPGAVCVATDGSIFVAGDGRVLKLDKDGKTLAAADSPVANEKVTISKETEEMVQQMAKQTHRSVKEELEQMQRTLEQRRADVTGLTVTDQDVFMAVPSATDFSYRVYRLNLALQNPTLVVDKLRGCCSQMDVQSHNGQLWIPHNARHAVETRDRDGKEIAKFGKAGKIKASDFGGCCEPKNLRVLANGDILAAESGPPTCIKRFSSTGKFKEVVAIVNGSKGDCVRVTVAASPDGKRYYMLDTTIDAIRVFVSRS